MGLVTLINNALITLNLIPHCGPLDHQKSLFEVQNVHIVSKQHNEKTADLKPEFAIKDTKVELYVVIEGLDKGRKMYISEANSVKLNRKIPTNKLRKPNDLDCFSIDWSKVEADVNGKSYDNNNQVGKPVSIPYINTQWKSGWSVVADVHPTTLKDQFPESVTGLGTMRYTINVNHFGKIYSTPGATNLTIDEGTNGQIITRRKLAERKLAKVVYRNNEDKSTDFAFELFNTPYIWGSRSFDVDQQIGSDCADLVVYAWKRDGQVSSHKGRNQKYTWSTGLKSYTNLIVSANHSKGRYFLDENKQKIPWDRLRQGDVIVVPGHAGILYKDNGDGYLGKDDLWIDTIFREPKITKLPYRFEVRRWRK